MDIVQSFYKYKNVLTFMKGKFYHLVLYFYFYSLLLSFPIELFVKHFQRTSYDCYLGMGCYLKDKAILKLHFQN